MQLIGNFDVLENPGGVNLVVNYKYEIASTLI